MEELPIWKRELPATPHKLLNDLVTVLVEFYSEHLQRDRRDVRLQPGKAWDLLRGFLIAAMQTYASICILLEEKRPKRLMLQAGVLRGCPGRCWNSAAARVTFYATCSTSVVSPRPRR